MNRYSISLALFLLTLDILPGKSAEVSGELFFKETDPRKEKVSFEYRGRQITPTRISVDNEGRLEGALVYLSGKTDALLPGVKQLPAELVISNGLFSTQILPVRPKQPIMFSTVDSGFSSVLFLRGKKHSLLTLNEKPLEVSFENPEPFFEIRSDLTPWNRAFICVMPNSYYSLSDSQGRFQIEKVPSGSYELIVFHPVLKEVHRKMITLHEPKAMFSLQLQKRAP